MAPLLVPDIDSAEPTAEALLALLDRVARSQQFQRASRLRELLLYIGRQSIVEGKTDIHEQEIGCSVFGRQADYDTSHDNIVRVNATELRKRLENYFATNGSDEPWVLEIPRGGYTPLFTRRTAPPADSPPEQRDVSVTAEPLPAEPTPAPAPPSGRNRERALHGIIIGLLGALIAICFLYNSLIIKHHALLKQTHSWQATPVLRSFWGNFLAPNNGKETDIVLADNSFALTEDILKTSIPLSDYLNYSYRRLPPGISPDTRAALDQVLSRNTGSISDFRTAYRILQLDSLSSAMRLRFARDYTADTLKRNNVILIGSRKSNPWADLFQDQLEFVIGFDAALNQTGVQNLYPATGEPSFYPEPIEASSKVGYGIVAFLPNVGQEGNALLIGGTESQATEAAGEFVTCEECMAGLLRRMNRDTFPYFQLLLKTSRLSGTPFTSQILAVRTNTGRSR